MPSEKQCVLRERRAWISAAQQFNGSLCFDYEFNAAYRYPLPKVARAREVTDGSGVKWRVVRGVLYALEPFADQWRRADNMHWHFPQERIALWADLFANPTETVEADDATEATAF